MAKQALLALAFATLVAFATAHSTIVTTTIHDENPMFQKERPCRQHLQGRQFDQCRMFLQQPQSSFQEDFPQMEQPQERLLEQCCRQIQNIDEQCQCKAVQQAFQEAQQEMQEQQGQQFEPFFGHQQTQQMRQKAQALPNLCNLRSKQCSIGRITTSVTEEDNPFGVPFSPRPRPQFGSQQQCSQTDIQRPVQNCQRPGHEQELQQCCEELQDLKRECQCPAIAEVARRMMQQHQPQQRQRGFFGGDKTEIVRRVIENLPRECNLDVQQCSIPSPY